MRILVNSLFILLLGLNNLAISFGAETDWRELKTAHFIIYYKTIPEGFLNKVKERIEEYYKDITNNLGFVRYDFWLWDNRAKIYIYEDRESYLETKKYPHWSGGVAYAKEKIINTFPWDSGFFDTALPHELGHIIFREFIGDNYTVPLWVDEGVACYQELSKRWGAKRIVKDAISTDKFIPLDKLSDLKLLNLKDSGTVNLFYAEAVSAVGFLLEHFGKSRFTSLSNDLRDGDDFIEALENNYPFRDLEGLNKTWLRYLREE